MCVCVCVCVRACVQNEHESMHYTGTSTYQFIPYYASAIRTHTHILKPFEDSEPPGLKVDFAGVF